MSDSEFVITMANSEFINQIVEGPPSAPKFFAVGERDVWIDPNTISRIMYDEEAYAMIQFIVDTYRATWPKNDTQIQSYSQKEEEELQSVNLEEGIKNQLGMEDVSLQEKIIILFENILDVIDATAKLSDSLGCIYEDPNSTLPIHPDAVSNSNIDEQSYYCLMEWISRIYSIIEPDSDENGSSNTEYTAEERSDRNKEN